MIKIFLLGSERSGSNLLRTLLGNHSEISAPIAPHFCDVFINVFNRYRQPDDKINALELLTDLEQYVNHSFNNWGLSLDKDGLIREFGPHTFIQFMNILYSAKALAEGKSGYFSKDNHNHRYALGILKDFPEAKFVYLYRDPRDQVASWLRSPIHLHTPLRAAKKWVEDQKASLQLAEFYGVSMYRMAYETLVDTPEEAMRGLLDFLALPQEEACYRTNTKNKEAEKILLWKNINKPIIKGNYRKYSDVLSAEDIEVVETICKNEMIRLGYAPESSASYNFSSLLFSFKERLRVRKSKRKSKVIRNSEMRLFEEKRQFLKQLFSKFNT